MKTPIKIRECVARAEEELAGHELFYGHGTDNPHDEAVWLVTTVAGRKNPEGEIAPDTLVGRDQQDEIDNLLARRISERIPLAYLLKEAWFAGYRFYVDERVLVPRSPIAELIGNRFEPVLATTPGTILDLCCGSGCIGIACAMAFPESRVVLADISADALAVADINVRRFGLEDRVSLVQSDLLEAIDERFDLIVTNPPYVAEAEYRDLPEEYHREPAFGLVSASEGIDIPGKILANVAGNLHEKGLLVLETGHSWEALEQAFPYAPFLWLDFEFGGEGVCVLNREQLLKYCRKN